MEENMQISTEETIQEGGEETPATDPLADTDNGSAPILVPSQPATTGQQVPMELASAPTPVEVLPWGPDPEEVILLFQELEQKQFLAFSWECPGRRNPNEPEMLDPEPESAPDDSKEAQAGADDFDFEEEATPTPRRPAKGTMSVLKGSAKRTKPTSLAGILSNMERIRMIDKQDDSKPSS